MSDAQNNIVVIDTGSAGDSRAFEYGFHQAEIERLKSMIEDSIPKDTKAGGGSAHSHQTIGVFGERGAGKTSFILSAIASIKTDNEVNVAFIGPIDPTLLEHGEQLLPHLIMAMLESNADLKKDIQNDPESPLTRAYMGCVRQLRVLSDQWSETLGKELMGDAETYGFELLEEMHSARNLRNSFQTFCQAALNKLNKNLFVIVIDDVDVAFEQGWPVLETVRKYLDFPQVLPVILGDFKLYRMLVMQRHHEKLAELRKVGDEKNRVDEGVVHLTNQYLLKVLPGHRRIELVCKAPYETRAPIYWLDNDKNDFRNVFRDILDQTASIDQRGSDSGKFGHFNCLAPANVRRLTMLAQTLKGLKEEVFTASAKAEDRMRALTRIAGVYEDILGQYGLAVSDILRISESPVHELTRLIPVMLDAGITDFWMLSANGNAAADMLKLVIRLAVDVGIHNMDDDKQKCGTLLALLVRMGWLGQAYDQFLDAFRQNVVGFEDRKDFDRYLNLAGTPSTTELALKMVAIDGANRPGGQRGLRLKSKSHIYYPINSKDSGGYLIDKKLNNPSVWLMYARVNDGICNFRVLSPILALARISDILLENQDDVLMDTVFIPKASKEQEDDESPAQELSLEREKLACEHLEEWQNRLNKLQWSIRLHQGDYHGEVVFAARHLMRRFSSWIDDAGVGAASARQKSAEDIVEAFFSRLTDERNEPSLPYSIGQNIKGEFDMTTLRGIKHIKPSKDKKEA